MPSIRWIRQVMIDGQRATLEIMIGVQYIADRCYARINQENEIWFVPHSDIRSEIVMQGTQLLRKRLEKHQVTHPDGNPFDWNNP